MASLIDRLRGYNQRLRALEQSSELQLINQGRLLTLAGATLPASPIAAHEFKIFSQWGEDGIIQRLIQEVPIPYQSFVEFGVEDFCESNCRFLMMQNNWSGLVIDGDPGNVRRIESAPWFWKHDLEAKAAFITAETINDLILARGFDPDLGLLSVDIDGMDYWVLRAITAVRPRIVIVEYNTVLGCDRAISVPYDPAFKRSLTKGANLYFGASLPAFMHWGSQAGYSLVGTTSTGVNAFFVRDDVRPTTLPALSAVDGFSPSRFRESRAANGELTLLAGDARLAALQELPVVNVISGATETL